MESPYGDQSQDGAGSGVCSACRWAKVRAKRRSALFGGLRVCVLDGGEGAMEPSD